MKTSTNNVPLEEEKKRNPELKDSDIESLKEWHKKQPHLPNLSDSDYALFLHSNYYRVEPCKNTIDTYYTLRTQVPEFFGNRDPYGAKDFRQIIQCVANIALKSKTTDGYNILYSALMDYDTSKYDYVANMKLNTMVMDTWIHKEGTMKGHVTIIELKGLAMGHLASFSPMALKKFITYLQEALPVRLKGIHFVNTNAVMDIIMNMMKPFMKKELLEIIHFHQSVEGLEKFNIPVEILPNESGGKAGPVKQLFAETLKVLEDNRDWFLSDEKNNRVDESKRPQGPKTADALFGAEGSFKKLDID